MAAQQFPEATGDWAEATHFGIYLTLPAGSGLFLSTALTTPKTILSGESGRFAAGALDVTAE